MAETSYRPKSVFIHTLKRTENIVPEIHSMRSVFVKSDETRMTGLPDGQKNVKIGLAI